MMIEEPTSEHSRLPRLITVLLQQKIDIVGKKKINREKREREKERQGEIHSYVPRASSKGVRNRSVVVVKWPAAKSLARSDVGNGRSATSINALPPNPKTISSNACNCCCCCEISTNKISADPLLSSPLLSQRKKLGRTSQAKEEQEERHKPSSWVLGFRGSRWLLVIAQELWRI